MPVRKQPNGTYLTEFQFLGERVRRSSGTTSIRGARALEEELRREIGQSTMALLAGPLSARPLPSNAMLPPPLR